MKQGLQLPHKQTETPIEPLAPGVLKRIALFEANNKSLQIMLDKWKQSGHTVKSGEALILNIKGQNND